MGNACTGVDDFNGQGYTTTVKPQDEMFVEGRLPVVNQNPARFDDDDPINVQVIQRSNNKYGQQNLGQGYLSSQRYDLKSNVKIQVSSKGINNAQNLALLISIITKDLQLIDQQGQECNRQGIDLICLVDHSGSMQGQKIKLVRRTLKHMLEFLQPVDRLCLIMFDCRCYRLTRLMRVTANNIPKFRVAIHSLVARGGTDIGNGMKMALSILKHRKYKNPVSAIFMLSDGVDFGAEERVRDDLNQYNIRDPFTIKTFGFGRDVCPKLMAEIAHYKEGQFYFVPDLFNIDECFAEALGGLVSVVANHVQITVQPLSSSKIQMQKAYGDKWQYDSWRGSFSLYQPHLLSGVRKDFVFEVTIPRNQGNQAIQVKLAADPVEGGDKILMDQTIEISAFADEETGKDVMSNLCRVRGAECFDQALKHAENGNYNQSQQLLRNMQNQIQLQKFDNDPQMQMVQGDLALAQNMCYPGQFQNEGRHHMTQLHIVHMYQKSRGVQINTYQDGQLVEFDCTYQNQIQKNYKQQTRDQKKNNPDYYKDS